MDALVFSSARHFYLNSFDLLRSITQEMHNLSGSVSKAMQYQQQFNIALECVMPYLPNKANPTLLGILPTHDGYVQTYVAGWIELLHILFTAYVWKTASGQLLVQISSSFVFCIAHKRKWLYNLYVVPKSIY